MSYHKHGHNLRSGKSPTYNTWDHMKQRCNNPNNDRYVHYGNRGITYCERWESFENFLADMGERPEGTTLDRIDNDGNYEPSNCRWATVIEQANNKQEYPKPITNTSGYKNISWRKDSKVWRVIIRESKKRKTIGNYKELSKAVEALEHYNNS